VQIGACHDNIFSSSAINVSIEVASGFTRGKRNRILGCFEHVLKANFIIMPHTVPRP